MPRRFGLHFALRVFEAAGGGDIDSAEVGASDGLEFGITADVA